MNPNNDVLLNWGLARRNYNSAVTAWTESVAQLVPPPPPPPVQFPPRPPRPPPPLFGQASETSNRSPSPPMEIWFADLFHA